MIMEAETKAMLLQPRRSNDCHQDLPWWSSGSNSALPLWGPWV